MLRVKKIQESPKKEEGFMDFVSYIAHVANDRGETITNDNSDLIVRSCAKDLLMDSYDMR